MHPSRNNYRRANKWQEMLVRVWRKRVFSSRPGGRQHEASSKHKINRTTWSNYVTPVASGVRYGCASMFIDALFTLTRKWNQPRYSSIGKQNLKSSLYLELNSPVKEKNYEIWRTMNGFGKILLSFFLYILLLNIGNYYFWVWDDTLMASFLYGSHFSMFVCRYASRSTELDLRTWEGTRVSRKGVATRDMRVDRRLGWWEGRRWGWRRRGWGS